MAGLKETKSDEHENLMEKRFDHKKIEPLIYKMWEDGGYFKAKIDKNKEPYTIVLPPPNASGQMHTGNVLMLAIEDLLIRWKRMKGYSTLWLPGTDHAGFETQITYERQLKKEGKSRFDFDRETLYKNIWEFVEGNKGVIEQQMKRMGASVDWSRNTFTLDKHVIDTVYKTFERMHGEELIYRDNYMVNFCPKCGTTFADLEVIHENKKDSLYYVKFDLVEGKFEDKDYLVVATVRPETIFVDTHLAVNPEDKKKKKLIGKKAINPLTGIEMEIISDDFVDPEFGTGVVKITPAHDKNDYEVSKRHDLEVIPILTLEGRLNEKAGDFEGQTVFTGRKNVVDFLSSGGLIEEIDSEYEHSVAVCYKGRHVIEPTVLPNWFVRVDHPKNSFKKPALKAVKKGDVKIYPKWQEVTYTRWMEDMHDWPISRQVVWGIRIPVWYEVNKNPNLIVTFLNNKKEVVSGKVADLMKDYSFEDIQGGLQTLIAPKGASYRIGSANPGEDYLQETDTFDTWFSSGHWPLVTLKYPDSEDFNYFYPTSVLETGWEIVRFWVSRMVMFGIYLTGKPPFKEVYLHGIVRALDGKKMSKSLGNVINPEEYLEQYGTDALRMGLIGGTANGKDFAFPKDKVIAYRNFANKIWNMTRFMNMMFEKFEEEGGCEGCGDCECGMDTVPMFKDFDSKFLSEEDKKIVEELEVLVTSVDENLGKYRFSQAGDDIYHFMWDRLASEYIEQVKGREDKGVALSVLRYVLTNCIKILHPFMPFVTEEIWKYIPGNLEKVLAVAEWPEIK